jgi:hypothetical protein
LYIKETHSIRFCNQRTFPAYTDVHLHFLAVALKEPFIDSENDTHSSPKLKYLNFDNPLVSDKASLLPVICSLVFQPLPVILHAADLLSVVVRDGIGEGIGGWINAESLYSVEELFLFLLYMSVLGLMKCHSREK